MVPFRGQNCVTYGLCSLYFIYSCFMKPVSNTNSEPGLPMVQINNFTLTPICYTYCLGKENLTLYLGLNSLYRGSLYCGSTVYRKQSISFWVTTWCRHSYKDPPEPAFLPHTITHAQSFFSPVRGLFEEKRGHIGFFTVLLR